MKKNFTVNIGGIIFHIDEDAYDLLAKYLESIKLHFINLNGWQEITSDIESRIAEMLQTKIDENKIVINIEDIEFVIGQMGQPSDFSDTPNAESKSKTDKKDRFKRLFRDPDNKIVGGVCSGLAAYFHIEAQYMRLAFAAVTLLGFGAGLIAYFIIWIFVPEATTTAEKLEMRGEKVNISNIERSVKEEFEGIKERLSEIKDQTAQTIKKNKIHSKNLFEKILDIFLEFIRIIFRSFIVLLGLIFMAVGIFLIIGILISFIETDSVYYVSSFGFSTFSIPAILNLFLGSKDQSLALIGIMLILGIPLLMLIYTGSRLIFKFKSRSRFVGIPAFSFFVGGLVISAAVGVDLVKDFSHKAVEEKVLQLKQPVSNTLVVDLKKGEQWEELGYKEGKFVLGHWNMISTGDSNLCFGIPSLEIVKTEKDSFSLEVYTIARGKDHELAVKHAEKIIYQYQQNDTALYLSPYFYLPEREKYRGQTVKIILKVPVNKSVTLSPATNIFFESDDNHDYTNIAGRSWRMHDSGLKELNSKSNETKTDSIVLMKPGK